MALIGFIASLLCRLSGLRLMDEAWSLSYAAPASSRMRAITCSIRLITSPFLKRCTRQSLDFRNAVCEAYQIRI
jgi:hypothetical protein